MIVYFIVYIGQDLHRTRVLEMEQRREEKGGERRKSSKPSLSKLKNTP